MIDGEPKLEILFPVSIWLLKFSWNPMKLAWFLHTWLNYIFNCCTILVLRSFVKMGAWQEDGFAHFWSRIFNFSWNRRLLCNLTFFRLFWWNFRQTKLWQNVTKFKIYWCNFFVKLTFQLWNNGISVKSKSPCYEYFSFPWKWI